MTQELKDLYIKYWEEHEGFGPDGYEELNYEAITHDEFVGYIKEALDKHCCIVDVVK